MRRAVLVVPVLCLSLASSALAGPPEKAPAAPTGSAAASESGQAVVKTDSAVAAQVLFDEGIKLIEAGKWKEACAKLEASNGVEWAPGTAINLADCYEHIGRTASAWAKFLEAEPHFRGRTPPDPRADVAKKRAEALASKLSRLTIEVPAAAKIPGIVIKRDGDAVSDGQWGTGIPVDPGPHVIEVSAPGKQGWKWEAEVGEGGANVTVKVPVLEDAVVPPTATATADTGMPLPRKVAIGLGAAGVAGLVVGGIFGGLAADKVGVSNKTCPVGADGVRQCDHAGALLRSDANTMANVSNVGIIAGAALVAAGVGVSLVGPSADRPAAPAKVGVSLTVARGPTGGCAQVGRRWSDHEYA